MIPAVSSVSGFARRAARLAVLGALLAPAAACRTPSPPSLAIDGMKIADMGVTGAVLNISLRMRNTDPNPMRIERFEYDLLVDGKKVGHGYHPETIDIAAFTEQKITSRFDLNFLALPGAIKSLFQKDQVPAEIQGTYYVRQMGRLRGLPMQAKATVNFKGGGEGRQPNGKR
jgi:LEA14-like dessication related protein